MEKIYLVINEEDPRERWVLTICTSEEKANELREQYISNFTSSGYSRLEAEDFIVVDEVTLDKDIVWDIYNE